VRWGVVCLAGISLCLLLRCLTIQDGLVAYATPCAILDGVGHERRVHRCNQRTDVAVAVLPSL